MKSNIEYLISFILLVFIQVFVLNNINLFGYINPYLYVLFILSLPFKIKHTPLILLSFITGYAVDLFSGGIIGLHAASALLIGFLRPYIIQGVSNTESDYDTKFNPSVDIMGFKWYLTYAILLIGIHHLALFFLDYFSFKSFFSTFFRAIFNTIFTVFVVVIYQMISFKSKKR